MIFETLNDAFEDFENFESYDIDDFIEAYDISVKYRYMTENVDGYSLPATQTMFININASNQVFIKHHEFIHCLVDDSAEPLIESSYVINSKVEHRANVGAITIMIEEYMQQTSLESVEFNPVQFHNYFGLDFKYYADTVNTAEKMLGISVPFMQ